MKNLNEHINRMKQLIGAKHGVIKPFVNEEDLKGFCLKKFKDTSKPAYKFCMFDGLNLGNIANKILTNYQAQNAIYPVNANSTQYNGGSRFKFYDSSNKVVYMEQAAIMDVGGVPNLIRVTSGINPKVKTILDYMVENQFLNSSDIKNVSSVNSALSNLPTTKPSIAKKGTNSEIIVSMPKSAKTGELAPITNFIYWKRANLYYYDETNPEFIFTDEGAVDSTFLSLIQNRKSST